MIDGIVKHTVDLKKLYADADQTLQEELSIMRTSDLTSFYEALNSSKEYFDTFPNADFSAAGEVDVQIDVKFSGEEIFGKYLDLNALHLQFSNVIVRAGIEQDYVQYLERFNDFFYLPESVKQSKLYADYLDSLWVYLSDFFRRTNPLSDWAKIANEMKAVFSTAAAKRVGVSSGIDGKGVAIAPQALRLGMFNAPGELEALGMDRLKEALEALGLKCGGTLQDRANRLWSIRGKKPEDFPASLRAKEVSAVSKKRKQDASGDEPDSVEWKEHRVKAVCDLMAGVVNATVRHAEKQQTRTAEEREAELREEEFGLALLPSEGSAAKKDDDEDDDAPVYNPLNLPLGWDGKPIPYWMYKLHGLGVEYKCEICGNHSYWGRRAFDKHFQEWRHGHGMRSLGIPNTKHFHDITTINDARALHEKIRAGIQIGQFHGEAEEEFEDTQGNILNKRTYEDLARQGLL